MTSEVEVDDGDDARWAQAESILAGAPSAEAKRSTRRRRNQLVLIIVGSGVVGAALGLLTGLLVPHGRHHEHHATGWTGVAGLVLICAGLGVDIVAIVLLVRRGRWLQAWRGPVMVLTRQQRRSLHLQIRGRRPVDPARLRLTRYLAEQWEEQVWRSLPMFIGVALILAGNVLTTHEVFQYWLAGYWAVLVVLMSVFWGWQVRHSRRFLEEHPPPED